MAPKDTPLSRGVTVRLILGAYNTTERLQAHNTSKFYKINALPFQSFQLTLLQEKER